MIEKTNLNLTNANYQETLAELKKPTTGDGINSIFPEIDGQDRTPDIIDKFPTLPDITNKPEVPRPVELPSSWPDIIDKLPKQDGQDRTPNIIDKFPTLPDMTIKPEMPKSVQLPTWPDIIDKLPKTDGQDRTPNIIDKFPKPGRQDGTPDIIKLPKPELKPKGIIAKIMELLANVKNPPVIPNDI